MKELDSFTVERLEEIIAEEGYSAMRTPKNDEVRSLARIALAAKRAEPVGYLEQNHLDYLRSGSDADIWPNGGAGDIPVYLTPQLNSPEIQDGWKLVPIEPTQKMVDAHISGMQLAGFSRAYRDMLAAAPQPQNQQQNIPEIIPQGWIKCSDQMPEDDDFVLIWPLPDFGVELPDFGVDLPDFGVELHVGQYCECHPKGEGWYAQIYEHDYGIEWHQINVTHWMPLPAAPAQESER